jgi:hypothetical protein
MAAKRSIHVEASGSGLNSPERSTVIRNLVATPENKSARFGSPNTKAAGGPHFSNVIEHHYEEEP